MLVYCSCAGWFRFAAVWVFGCCFNSVAAFGFCSYLVVRWVVYGLLCNFNLFCGADTWLLRLLFGICGLACCFTCV